MTDLRRYARQLVLPQIGIAGQEALLDARVLIVGAGGLGCASAHYLAAAGIGTLYIVDHDEVALSNLQRQVLYSEADVGQPKASAAAARLQAMNSSIRIIPHNRQLSADNLPALIQDCDVVLDGSDNFPTRFAVNAACVAQKIPLISAAAIRAEAQLAVFTPGRAEAACYACLYPEQGEVQERCEDAGVIGPLVGIIGAQQALLALHLLLGWQPACNNRLWLYDALRLSWRELQIRRDPECTICGNQHD